MTVSRSLVADTLTPVQAYASLRARAPESGSFLLESVVAGERWGRYSILGFRPRYEAMLVPHTRSTPHHGTLAPSPPPQWSVRRTGHGTEPIPQPTGDADPLTSAASIFTHTGQAATTPAERFADAHVGFFAWDLVHAIEKVPGWSGAHAPLARMMGGATIVVFDMLSQTITISGRNQRDVDEALDALESAQRPRRIQPPRRDLIPKEVDVSTSDAQFELSVRRAQEYIAAGDAFQIVLARTFSVARKGRDPFDVYRAMRLINPSPYMYFLDFPAAPGQAERLQIAGASPETLVRLEDQRVTVRPIAGTRPRGKTPEEDHALEQDLLADPKEVAEHVMLIDLGRNDVGRVAEIGSVELVRRMEIERYSHVMHIVSEVQGKVPASTPPLEVLRATFPAGTLSGAPKVRAMQIIRELEPQPRGVYGGAVGYLTQSGDLDFAIAIRTAVFQGDRIDVTAGAGIVEGSVPKSEAEETRNKARGVLCAIEAAS